MVISLADGIFLTTSQFNFCNHKVIKPPERSQCGQAATTAATSETCGIQKLLSLIIQRLKPTARSLLWRQLIVLNFGKPIFAYCCWIVLFNDSQKTRPTFEWNRSSSCPMIAGEEPVLYSRPTLIQYSHPSAAYLRTDGPGPTNPGYALTDCAGSIIYDLYRHDDEDEVISSRTTNDASRQHQKRRAPVTVLHQDYSNLIICLPHARQKPVDGESLLAVRSAQLNHHSHWDQSDQRGAALQQAWMSCVTVWERIYESCMQSNVFFYLSFVLRFVLSKWYDHVLKLQKIIIFWFLLIKRLDFLHNCYNFCGKKTCKSNYDKIYMFQSFNNISADLSLNNQTIVQFSTSPSSAFFPGTKNLTKLCIKSFTLPP